MMKKKKKSGTAADARGRSNKLVTCRRETLTGAFQKVLSRRFYTFRLNPINSNQLVFFFGFFFSFFFFSSSSFVSLSAGGEKENDVDDDNSSDSLFD